MLEHSHPHEPRHDHPHDNEHEHGHDNGLDHEHEPGTLHNHGQLGHGAPVLNIGGDIGALILYTDAGLEGLEIDVSLLDEPTYRPHTEILRRVVGGRTFWAAVYSELKQGDYRLWYDAPDERELEFTITGGAVTELDWRTD